VLDPHRDDAEGLPVLGWPGHHAGGVVQHQLHHPGHLGPRTLLLPVDVGALLDHDVSHGGLRPGVREGDQAVAVHVVVRERDQALRAAAVVPVEGPGREKPRHEVQKALEPRDGQRLLVLLFGLPGDVEEGRGRELLVVPGHHRPGPPHERGDGVLGEHLARLVEHDHVEVLPCCREELAHGKGARQPAGAKGGQNIRSPVEGLPQREMPGSLPRLRAHQVGLVGVVVHRHDDPLGVGSRHPRRRDPESLAIQPHEVAHELVVGPAAEAREAWVLLARPVQA
jgi:hypothetical protein